VVRDELGGIMTDFHPSGFRAMATALAHADTRELLSTIRVPTLLVWGAADKRSPLEVAHAMRDAIPNAKLEVIPAAGHLSNLENPAAFNAIVSGFCGAVAGG
jgi:pimeloyl-ACP methyl ester carboxylesterase